MMPLKMKIALAAIFVAVVTLTAIGPAIAGLPSAEEIARKLGFSAADKKSVLDGDFVSMTLDPANDRELAVALAFLVTLSVDELRKEIVKQQLLMTKDPETIAWSPITGDGSLDDFKKLSLAPDEEKRAKAYLNAKPGGDLNLDKTEIAAFNTIKVPTGQSFVGPVTAAVKKQLLGRFQAYHQSGLAGISPYDRGGDSTSAAGDLKGASVVATSAILKTAIPSFYKVLLNYPNDKPEGLDEGFAWSNYMARGEPVFILTHNFMLADAGAFVIVERQFYVSGSYNAMQSITAHLSL